MIIVKNITYSMLLQHSYIALRHLHNMLYSTLYNVLYCRQLLQHNIKYNKLKMVYIT